MPTEIPWLIFDNEDKYLTLYLWSGTLVAYLEAADDGSIEHLTERQKEVLQLVLEQPQITVSSLGELLNINRSAAQKHIEVLVDKQFIKRIGGTRGYWKLIKK